MDQYKYDIKNNFAEASMADFNLYFMVRDPITREYEIKDTIPGFGYVYVSSYCKNESTIIYANGKISVAASRRDECYVFFDEVEHDIKLNIYTKESTNSERVLVAKVPGYNYAFDKYSCTNNGVVEFNEETRKVKIYANDKTICDIEFVKRKVDLTINIYKENPLGIHEYEGIYYEKVEDVPGSNYSFANYDCQNDTIITATPGTNELNVSTNGNDVCNVYFTGGANKVELLFMKESLEGVSGYTTGKKYSPVSEPPTEGYKYVGYKCDYKNATVTYNNGTFETESDTQTTCRAYFNEYTGNAYINYYLQKSDGSYENVSSIPALGYVYNSEKSSCTNGSVISVDNNIVSVNAFQEDECSVYFDMVNADIEVLVYVMNRETQKYELGKVPVAGYKMNNAGCTNGASIEYINSSLVVNTEGPTVCTVYFY